jgi:hypothetical protein
MQWLYDLDGQDRLQESGHRTSNKTSGGLQMKISDTVETVYLLEHTQRALEAVALMMEGLRKDDPGKVVDGLSALQWQEMSLIVGTRSMMRQLKTNESDLAGVAPLLTYAKEVTV